MRGCWYQWLGLVIDSSSFRNPRWFCRVQYGWQPWRPYSHFPCVYESPGSQRQCLSSNIHHWLLCRDGERPRISRTFLPYVFRLFPTEEWRIDSKWMSSVDKSRHVSAFPWNKSLRVCFISTNVMNTSSYWTLIVRVKVWQNYEFMMNIWWWVISRACGMGLSASFAKPV